MTATIELNSARRKLEIALGDNKSVYFNAVKKWFRFRRCTKEDFDCEAKKLLSADDSHLHNEFLLAILNKCQTLANFTLMTSPTVKTPGSMPNVLSPSSSSIGSPSNPFFAARPIPDSDGGRLKVGSIKRRNKSSRPSFDQRFQPASPPSSLPDCDEFEPYDPTERSINQKEPTLPDSSMVTARFLIASWDEGLDGSINDPSATELVVAAVNQLLRRIITSILMDKSGYVTYANKMPHAIGIAAPNPYLINKQRASCNGISSTEDPIHETPEILESLNFTSATNNVDPLVPTGRPHERESEHKAMWDLACTHRYASRAEDQIKIVTLYDLLSTLKKHRTLIPSHTVYSINMERLLCRLHHEGHND